MEFVLISPGEFVMRSPSTEERPHRVRITKPFYLGKYEVTQAQWEMVMKNNPSQFQGNAKPIEMVSWEDVQVFIRQINIREGGTKYRLPTEAEWEYAARAGSTTAYSFADDVRQLALYAWCDKYETYRVGQLKPNAWGLHDMHGNVWEWVQDWYGSYSDKTVTDPQGPASGFLRVLRGGSWYGQADLCQSGYRYKLLPETRYNTIGFRLLKIAS
jgi:formylglycine-generating enzyme required for sulfatase activity